MEVPLTDPHQAARVSGSWCDAERYTVPCPWRGKREGPARPSAGHTPPRSPVAQSCRTVIAGQGFTIEIIVMMAVVLHWCRKAKWVRVIWSDFIISWLSELSMIKLQTKMKKVSFITISYTSSWIKLHMTYKFG